jgi:hypothetical protein
MTRRTVAERVTAKPPIFGLSELPLLLNEKAAARFLGVSLPYLRRGRSEGKTGRRTQTPPFVRLGGRIFYRQADLQAWVSGLVSQEVV